MAMQLLIRHIVRIGDPADIKAYTNGAIIKVDF